MWCKTITRFLVYLLSTLEFERYSKRAKVHLARSSATKIHHHLSNGKCFLSDWIASSSNVTKKNLDLQSILFLSSVITSWISTLAVVTHPLQVLRKVGSCATENIFKWEEQWFHVCDTDLKAVKLKVTVFYLRHWLWSTVEKAHTDCLNDISNVLLA